MYTFSSLTLSIATSSISCPYTSQSEPFFNLSTLVVGPITDLILSVVLAGNSPKYMKFGFLAMTELLPKSILLRA